MIVQFKEVIIFISRFDTKYIKKIRKSPDFPSNLLIFFFKSDFSCFGKNIISNQFLIRRFFKKIIKSREIRRFKIKEKT